MKDHAMTDAFPQTGIAALDRYLAQDYLALRGMSSRFAAGICGHLLKRQSSLGITGPIVEIGTFEGRFLIAMAMALLPGETALGIDTFDWPDAGVIDRLKTNVAAHDVAGIIDIWQARSGDLTAPGIAARLHGREPRFIHIDGDHSEDALAHDLGLAASLLHPDGLICLDDMLHPAYPFLVAIVRDFLRTQTKFRIMLIIDREDIVGAAKFVLCRSHAVALYETALMTSFPHYHFVLGGDALGHHCVVLTPAPRLAEI